MSIRLDDAIIFAARTHRGQSRKNDGLPYITHPIRVMERLMKMGVRDEATLLAAILHDTVEDAKDPSVTRWDIQALFGIKVAQIVDELSFMSELKRGSPERKAAKRDYIASFIGKSKEACQVKLMDRFDNLTCSPDDPVGYTKDAQLLLEATRQFVGQGDDTYDACWGLLQAFCEYPEAADA
jgi:(p)ppGpp synthase/HD superfamily hydrolase